MFYLIVIVVLAAAGITQLWLAQRRHKQPIQTVDGFWDGLERISATPIASPEKPVRPQKRPVTSPRRTRRPERPVEQVRSRRTRSDIDPERRAAAKARLEARRRSQRLGTP